MKTTSAVVVEPGRMELHDFAMPSIGPEDLLLKVEMVAICGSDRNHYRGGHYAVFPKILGHEMVGYVADVGAEASRKYGVESGDRIVVEPYIPCWRCDYCSTGFYQLCTQRRVYGVNLSSEVPPHLWGAYGQHMYVAPGSRVHKIGAHVSAQAATQSSVIGNGVRWICTKGQLRVGDPVAIVGPGALGLASIIVADHVGAGAIIAVGLRADAERLEFARRCGATHVIFADEEDAPARTRELLGGELPALAVDATGSSAGLLAALSLVRPGGKCVLGGTTGKATPIMTDLIVRNEIQVFGALGQPRDVEAALKIIETNRYPITEMIERTYPLDQAEAALKTFIAAPQECIRFAIEPL